MPLPIPSFCPWSRLAISPSAFCEESLCAWIREPANTWSNLVFVIAGVAILKRTRAGPAHHFSGLGWVAIITGIGSAFFYHASESRLGAVVDYLGIDPRRRHRPDGLHLHALWHTLNAIGLYGLFLFYRQFADEAQRD